MFPPPRNHSKATFLADVQAVRRAFQAAVRVAADDREAFDPDRLDRRDPSFVAALLPALTAINARFSRLEVEGLQHLGAQPALYVANHNGGILGPDLASTMGTLWQARGPDAPLYALVHDFAMRRLIPLGRAAQRLGGIRATRENALAALAAGGQVLVYPGGELDAYRHFRRRNQVIFGERTGFVHVAQRAGVAIVPIVTQGAHRSALVFHEGRALARLLGLRRRGRHELFPLALALPWGIAAGPWLPYLPLPHKLRMRVLPPVWVAPGADCCLVRESVRRSMERALQDLAQREQTAKRSQGPAEAHDHDLPV